MNKFSSHPKAKFWHPVKNGDLTPDKITRSSAKKCWFICENCKHEFESDPNHITALKHPTWCPYCCVPCKKMCENNQDEHCKSCFDKSFASYKLPEHIIWSNKNITTDSNGTETLIKRCDVVRSSNKKYYFDCMKCNHTYDIHLNSVKEQRFPCGYCSSSYLCEDHDCKSCFEKSFASHEKFIFWDEKNNENVKPRDVFKHSGKKYWFICEEGHSFDATLAHISSETEPRWCPYCNGCNEKALECFERSFASHPLSKNWDYEKNNGVIPREVFKGSGDKYWFKCDCGHSFDAMLSDISKENNNRWCPYCCIPSKKLCDNNQDGHCNICFEKSFASHPKSNCFDEKSNGIKSSLVLKGDHDNYWFNCDVCHHKFYQSVEVITRGSWCHYCCEPSKKLCEDSDCKTCFEKSFASHEKVIFWDKEKNKINPRTIHKQSGKKLWFKCEKKHSFEAILRNLCGRYGRPASWCPYCINKTEQKLYDKMNILYPMLKQQYKVEWCKSKTYLPFDFVLEYYKIIIELDGPQHFRQISNWGDPLIQQENDKYKMKCANDNSFSVIRILQEDIYYDTYDWMNELDINIKKIIEDNQIVNIFMYKNGEYSNF
jgi:very-short-patch-repair endonuclease